MLALRNDKCDT